MPAPSITPVLATTIYLLATTVVPSVATTFTSTVEVANATIQEPAAEVTISTVPRATDWQHKKGLAKAVHKH